MLLDPPAMVTEVIVDDAARTIQNGNLLMAFDLDTDEITVSRVSDGRVLLTNGSIDPFTGFFFFFSMRSSFSWREIKNKMKKNKMKKKTQLCLDYKPLG